MAFYLPVAEEIYFSETKEYFQEVWSSYSIGNYRSATVMLYSVAICDLLFKLQELKDMFNDSVAEEILETVDKFRNTDGHQSKSSWEKKFIDDVRKKTKILDDEAYINLNHLYDHRNFSAHPALNENYELIMPSQETTIANIKNILKDILIKPPIFIKNVIEMLTEDLNGKDSFYKNEYDTLRQYLNNKYYSKMTSAMKLTTLKALWKFCFCLPDDENCIKNRRINRKALEILIDGFEKETLIYIRENNKNFQVAENEKCELSLMLLLTKYPDIFELLDEVTHLKIEKRIEVSSRAKFISWFKFKTPKEHLKYLTDHADTLVIPTNAVVERIVAHYSDIGEISELINFFIELYGTSGSYDSADCRFSDIIEPWLDKMTSSQFARLIEVSSKNSQIYARRLALSANNRIIIAAKGVLDSNFDFSAYPLFRCNSKLFVERTQEEEDILSEDNVLLEDEEEVKI